MTTVEASHRTAEDYRGGHQPPEDGPPLSDLTTGDSWLAGTDVYEHPEYYTFGNTEPFERDAIRLIRQYRGKPDALVEIYRALPPGHTTIHRGDWVALSESYVRQHAMQDDDPNHDWPIIKAQVPAKYVRNGGNDIIEWGYWGPDVNARLGAVDPGEEYLVRVEFGRRGPDGTGLNPTAGERYVWVLAHSETEARELACNIVGSGSDRSNSPIGWTGDMVTSAEVIRVIAKTGCLSRTATDWNRPKEEVGDPWEFIPASMRSAVQQAIDEITPYARRATSEKAIVLWPDGRRKVLEGGQREVSVAGQGTTDAVVVHNHPDFASCSQADAQMVRDYDHEKASLAVLPNGGWFVTDGYRQRAWFPGLSDPCAKVQVYYTGGPYKGHIYPSSKWWLYSVVMDNPLKVEPPVRIFTDDPHEGREATDEDFASTRFDTYPVAASLTAGAVPEHLYHATSFRNWVKIRDEGLVPRFGRIWMFADLTEAAMYAMGYEENSAATGGAAIIEVRAPGALMLTDGWPGAYITDQPIPRADIVGLVRRAEWQAALPPDWKTAGANGSLPEGLEIKQESTTNIVALLGGKVVGRLVLGGNTIWNIYVDDEWQRRGIATEILRKAQEVNPNLEHTPQLTPQGRAWAHGTPIQLPFQSWYDPAPIPPLPPRPTHEEWERRRRAGESVEDWQRRIAATTRTVYRGIYIQMGGDDVENTTPEQVILDRVTKGGGRTLVGTDSGPGVGVHWTLDKQVAINFSDPMSYHADPKKLGTDGWSVSVPVVITAQVSEADVVTDPQELRDAMVEGYGWEGLHFENEQEVLVRRGAPIRVMDIEAISPRSWAPVRRALETFSTDGVPRMKVDWKRIGGGIQVTAGDVDRYEQYGMKMWHGSPSGDMRGGAYGLHIGSREAAKIALEARIGIRADGKDWDGTQEYGKTLLMGKKSIRAMDPYRLTGYNVMDAPEEDHYPTGAAQYGGRDGPKVPMSAKPDLFEVEIIGPMNNSPHSAYSDSRANGYMRAAITRGNAKNGYFYVNIGEDSGSISTVVPGPDHVRRTGRRTAKVDDYKGTSIKGHCKVCGKKIVIKRGVLTHADGSNDHAVQPSDGAPIGIKANHVAALPPGWSWGVDSEGERVIRQPRRNTYGPVMTQAQAIAQGWEGPYYHGTSKNNARNIRSRGFREVRFEWWELANAGTQEDIDPDLGTNENLLVYATADLAEAKLYANGGGEVVMVYLRPGSNTNQPTSWGGLLDTDKVVTVANVADIAAISDVRVASKTALPSWRDRGEMPQADCVIAPDLGRAQYRNYQVFTYGELFGRYQRLQDAQEAVETIYGPLEWTRLPGDQQPHYDPTWGNVTWLNDAPYFLVASLPRLGKTAAEVVLPVREMKLSGEEFEGLCQRVIDAEMGRHVPIDFELLYGYEENLAEAGWDHTIGRAFINWQVAGLNVLVALHECAHVLADMRGVDTGEDGHGEAFWSLLDQLMWKYVPTNKTAADSAAQRAWRERVDREHARIESDPKWQQLRDKLLREGGVRVASVEEPDIDNLLSSRTQVWDGSGAPTLNMRASDCHANSCRLYDKGGYQVATGYALTNDDGLWRQHSWALKDGKVVETTGIRRDKYLGFILTDAEAKSFSTHNPSYGSKTATQQRPSPDPVDYRHVPPPYWSPGGSEFTGGFHSIQARLDGKQIGYLQWWDPGEGPYKDTMQARVEKVEVASDHRRQGLASEMLRRAQQITPGIKHSDKLTSDGRAWRNENSPSEAGDPAYPKRMIPRLGAQFAKMWHISATRNRESILEHGIRPDPAMASFPGWTAAESIWLFGEQETAERFMDKSWGASRGANDLWEADTSGLEIEDDPDPGWTGVKSWIYRGTIPPQRLRLVRSSADKTASGGGGIIYRGLQVDLPPDVEKQVEFLLAPEMDEDSYHKYQPIGGKRMLAGEIIIRSLEQSHWDREEGLGLGRHWTTRKEMANVAARQGAPGKRWGLILTATYTDDDVDVAYAKDHPAFRDQESEVTIKPGARLTITNVDIVGGDMGILHSPKSIMHAPMQALAVSFVGPGPTLTFENEDEGQTGGTKWPYRHILYARVDGESVGHIEYLLSRRQRTIYIEMIQVEPGWERGRGGPHVATELMDALQRLYPGVGINHGDRTDDGKAWWANYSRGKSVTRGRTMAVKEAGLWEHALDGNTADDFADVLRAEYLEDPSIPCDNYDLSTVTPSQVKSVCNKIRAKTQEALLRKGVPETVTIWRAGTIEPSDPFPSFSWRPKHLFGEPKPYLVDRKDIWCDAQGINPSLSLVEDEVLVRPGSARLVTTGRLGAKVAYGPWRLSLSPEDQQLLAAWERGPQYMTRQELGQMKRLLQAAPKTNGQPLYRGDDIARQGWIIVDEKEWPVGKVVTQKHPMSASMRQEIASGFGHTVFRYEGEQAPILDNSLEEAVILPGTFEVVKAEDLGDVPTRAAIDGSTMYDSHVLLVTLRRLTTKGAGINQEPMGVTSSVTTAASPWRRFEMGYLRTDGRWFIERGARMTDGWNAWLIWRRAKPNEVGTSEGPLLVEKPMEGSSYVDPVRPLYELTYAPEHKDIESSHYVHLYDAGSLAEAKESIENHESRHLHREAADRVKPSAFYYPAVKGGKYHAPLLPQYPQALCKTTIDLDLRAGPISGTISERPTRWCASGASSE